MRACPEPAARSVIAGEIGEGETALVDHVDGPDGRGEYMFEKKRERMKAGARG